MIGKNVNGNMTSRPYGDGTQTLGWGHENRLTYVSRSGTTTSFYLYDPDGQRVKKVQGTKVSRPGNSISVNKTTTSTACPSA
ncbi:MAG: hypothetical protein AAF702_47005 [Chloroflexota bacterium]